MSFWLALKYYTVCESVIFKKQIQCLIPHYKIYCSKTSLQKNIKTLEASELLQTRSHNLHTPLTKPENVKFAMW